MLAPQNSEWELVGVFRASGGEGRVDRDSVHTFLLPPLLSPSVQVDEPLACLLPTPASCLLLLFKAPQAGLLECLGWGQVICVLFLSLPPLGESPLERQSRIRDLLR